MNSYSYNIPVVSQDLAPAESLHELFDNLKYLDAVVNDVFSRLQSRISFEKSKIQNVCNRIANCQTQVQKIQENSSRATTVHSIAKYPAPIALPNYPLTHSEFIEHGLSEVSHSNFELNKEDIRARGERVDTSELFWKLTNGSRKENSNSSNIRQEGLGRLPSYLPSVSSILLFNTFENPYKKYVSLDNLEGVVGKDREKKTTEVGAAPQTLIDGDMLPIFAGIDIGFKPKMGEVPMFALPSMLPDLPGVADINWSMDVKQSIAPSAAPILSLPSIDNFAFSHAPAPAPLKANSSVPSQPAKNIPSNPPAAPPGPPVAAAIAPPVQAKPVVPIQNIVPDAPVDNGRNALLDSIRNPGLRLKKVAKLLDSDDAPKSKNSDSSAGEPTNSSTGPVGKKNNAPPPMDMMSALAAKLNARAKAISGKGDEEDKPKRVVSVKQEAPISSSPKNKNIANVDAYLAHKEKNQSKSHQDDDDWED